jgi:beta-lactam-binding protein with PASTA domain
MFIIQYFKTLFFLFLLISPFSTQAAQLVVPSLMGLSLEDAKQSLTQRGFSTYDVQYQATTHHPAETVMVQAPVANTRVDVNFPIRLIIAKAVKALKISTVPNLKGMSLEEAKAALSAVNLHIGYVNEHSKKLDRQQVLYQTPKANQRIIQQRAVNITLSDVIRDDAIRVKVGLDKSHFKVGESTWIKAKVSNTDTSKKGEFGFNINGRTYYSQSSKYQYTFQESGRYTVITSFRYARGAWHSSHTKKVKVSTETTETIVIKTPVKDDAVIKTSEQATDKTTEKVKIESKTPKHYRIPNLMGLSQKEATAIIKKSHFILGDISKQAHKAKINIVLKQSPSANKYLQKGTLIHLSIAERSKKWTKPEAVIHPATIEVIQGETVQFASHSTHDKSSHLSRAWDSEFAQKSTDRIFKIKTNHLKAGKYWIKLRVKDDRNLTDIISAKLVVKDKVTMIEEKDSLNAVPKLSNKALLSELNAEVKSYTPRNNDPYLKKLRKEANYLQVLPHLAEHSNSKANLDSQRVSQYTPLYNKDGLDIAYLDALLVEVQSTTDQQESMPLSETFMQSASLSKSIVDSKVNNVNHIAMDIESQSTNNQENLIPWYIWIWILLLMLVCAVLGYILWVCRQKKPSETFNIVYQYQNDTGKQSIVKRN